MTDFLSGKPWAQAPWELVTADVSATAFRVAMAIQLHRRPTGSAPFPSQQRLALMCHVSVPTVERAVAELRKADILRTTQRHRRNGQHSTNEYTVGLPSQPSSVMDDPAITGEGAEVDRYTGNGSRAAPVVHATRARVGGSLITDEEQTLAMTVLATWNEATGQQLTSASWLALIVRRHREHPEFADVDFAHIIAATLARPWWDGAPSLNLIFGNDMQFERCIEQTRNGNGNGKAKRFGRGMTPGQILQAYGVTK